MRLIARIASLWRTWRHRDRLEAELDEELRGYLDARVARRIAAGERPERARRAELVEIGSVESLKARVREVRMGRLLEETVCDIRHAARGFRHAPGFTLTVLATLAIGVAANTAIFSVAYALLVQPLPFRDPDRLVFVWADQTSEGYPRAPLSGPELRDLDERSTAFDGFAAIWATTTSLTGETEPEQLRIGLVTSDYFSLLGAEPLLGRTFRREDETTGPPTTILLSAAVWQRRYGSDPAIVGRRIDVNGRPTIVVGVMPAGFRLMMPPDSAVPDDLEAWLLFNQRFTEGPRGQRYLRVIGRMRADVPVSRAIDDVARVGREISAAHAFYGSAGRQFETVPLHIDAVRHVRLPLLILSAGVATLLLIACLNVGSLFVARTAARASESAVRVAMGATAGRLLRQHLVEALVVAGVGTSLGVIFGDWGLTVLARATPASLSRLREATVNLPVIVVTTGTAIAWIALLAVLPVALAARQAAASALADDRRHTGGRLRYRLRRTLTVAQIALSVVLVVVAFLLVRTVQRVQQIDAGFRAEGVLSFRLALPDGRYPTRDHFHAFSRQLQSALRSLQGVAAAASISHAPYDHVPNWGGPYLVQEGEDRSRAPQADYRAVSPGAMELLSVRLIDGRWFTEDDDARHEPVVIVDDRLARRTWPGQSAVGRRIAVDPAVTGTPSTWATIVGVVEHVRHRSPVEEVREQVYFSARQAARNPSVYLVKSAADPESLVGPVRAAMRTLDPRLPIYDVRPLQIYVDEARALRAFTATLAGVFAGAALLLASIGVYGVVAYSVAERRREFGVRVALGASSARVLQLVAGEGAWIVVRGAALGAAGAAIGAYWLQAQLVGVDPWDPITLVATLAVLTCVSLLACVAPARRALRTDPSEVLREG